MKCLSNFFQIGLDHSAQHHQNLFVAISKHSTIRTVSLTSQTNRVTYQQYPTLHKGKTKKKVGMVNLTIINNTRIPVILQNH